MQQLKGDRENPQISTLFALPDSNGLSSCTRRRLWIIYWNWCKAGFFFLPFLAFSTEFNWWEKSLTGDAQLAVRKRSRRAKFQICTDKFSRFIFPLPTLFLPFTHIHAQPHSELYGKVFLVFQWTRTPASARQMRLVKARCEKGEGRLDWLK